MSRRHRPELALVALLALLLPLDAGAEEPPPNILLIMAEDLGPRLGAYGDPIAKTPNIDRLAREGVLYERAFTTAGVCAPSRAAIIMGVHQNTWGAGHMRTYRGGYLAVPPPDMKAFPELLRAAGYYTVNAGKTDYQMSTTLQGAFGGPFTIWDDTSGSNWRGRAEDQPFFAYMTLGITHEGQLWPIMTWPPGLMETLTLPMRLWTRWQWIGETDPRTVPIPPYYPDNPVVREDLARLYNNIEAMDAQVGELLAKLEEDGLADRTLVIFTTDHGDGLPRGKRWPYDSGTRIPLIVRWPGVTDAGSVEAELVSGVDFAPTLLRAAGLPVPDHVQGRVFLGPDKESEPGYVYAARDRMDAHRDRVRSVRDRDFLYVRHLIPDQPYVLPIEYRNQLPMMVELQRLHEAGALTGPPALWFRETRDAEELFDTRDDPHQVRNLAGDPAHADRLATMRRELDRWLEASGDLGLLEEEELRKRFWPGGEQPVTAAPRHEQSPGRVGLSSASAGASIGYRIDGGPWRLYTGPIPVGAGAEITAKAVRYGWAESDEVDIELP